MKGLITNEWDRDNLEFLLNTKGDEFKAWHAQADADDLVYAQELMDAYSRELKLRAEEIEIEARITLDGLGLSKSILDRISQK
jgi:hypothetical protein